MATETDSEKTQLINLVNGVYKLITDIRNNTNGSSSMDIEMARHRLFVVNVSTNHVLSMMERTVSEIRGEVNEPQQDNIDQVP
jgi:hypothetical protein